MAVRQIVNLLRGSVELEVQGAFPERFLNLCAQRGVAFWGVEWPDSHTLRLTVAWTDRAGLEELGERTMCTVTRRRRRGLPPFLLGFRHRYALLVGLCLALLVTVVLSRFVLVVEVEGNHRVADVVILTELQRLGLGPGTYGPGVAAREVANEAVLRMEDIAWMAINIKGFQAQVLVQETLPRSETVDETVLGDIVAEAPGIITHIEAWSGDAAVEEGATVLAGDVLIRGSIQMDPPQWSENPILWMPVRAMGQVEGRTWRTLTAVIPLEAEVKRYTGEEKSGWSLTFLGRRVNFFQNSGIPFDRYDKISRTWCLPQPKSGGLPVFLCRETWREYETVSLPVEEGAARVLLEERLAEQLAALLGEDGREVSRSFSAEVADGQLAVTLTAECVEELGRFVPAMPAEPAP